MKIIYIYIYIYISFFYLFFYIIACSLIPKGFMFSGSVFNDTGILEYLSKMMINENGSEEDLSIKTNATEES